MTGYVAHLHGLLGPGARLLNHAISWNGAPARHNPDTFIARYVFPDGQLLNLSEMVVELESVGLEVLDVETSPARAAHQAALNNSTKSLPGTGLLK